MPRSRAPAYAGSRSLQGMGAPLYPLPLRGAGYSLRGGGSGELRFPPPWFSPGTPFSRRPLRVRSIGQGKPHPRSVAFAPSLGATPRRPFSFRVPPPFGPPPPKTPRRSLNTPWPPQSCGGGPRLCRRDASRTAPAFPWTPLATRGLLEDEPPESALPEGNRRGKRCQGASGTRPCCRQLRHSLFVRQT